MNFLRYLIITMVLCAGLICFTACQKDQGTTIEVDFPDEYQKYEPFAKKYCAENNLTIKKYLGRTVIRFNDFKAGAKQKEPVVYEWEVQNRASNQVLVLGVGPIMPMFPTGNPPVMLTKGRYELKKTMKLK